MPKNIFLLRKSRGGHESLILKPEDLPLRFTVSGKRYVVTATKGGKVIMKTEE